MKAVLLSCLVSVSVVGIVGHCGEGDLPRSDDLGTADGCDDVIGIDVYTANSFHKRLAVLCIGRPLEVHYAGPLAYPRGQMGLEPDESPETYLTWVVVFVETLPKTPDTEPGRVILEFRVSLMGGDESIAKCKVGRQWLYLSVTYVASDRGMDDPMAALDGATPREFLRLLEEEE